MEKEAIHDFYEEQYREFFEKYQVDKFKDKDILKVIELSGFKKIENGLLVVGCNPSGDDEQYCLDNNNIWYDKETDKSGYIGEIKKFAQSTGFSENYTRIDTFCIKQLKQKDLEKDIKKEETDFYKDMFNIFVGTVIKLKPTIIVFANAFISNLIMDKNFFPNVKVDPQDNVCGGYIIKLTDSEDKEHSYYAFFTSMLSNGALSKRSKNLLIWAVNHYMEKIHQRPFPK